MSPESATADFLPTRATIWILYFLDPRNLGKKSLVVQDYSMEECYKQSDRLLANLFQNIRKFTDKFQNIGKFTSKTD